MKEGNIIQIKSYNFSLRIVKLYKYLITEKKDFILSKQILRSGTSIGANTEEALGSQTRKEFAFKIGIAYKEARETRYWLKLLRDSDYIDYILAESFLKDCEELCKLTSSIQKTCNKNNF